MLPFFLFNIKLNKKNSIQYPFGDSRSFYRSLLVNWIEIVRELSREVVENGKLTTLKELYVAEDK
jgi:hypothetical protein